MNRVILIDGMHLAYRCYHVHRDLWTSKKEPTGIIFGVMSILLNLHKLYPDAAIVFCWDEGKSWRKEIAPNLYKAHRGDSHLRPEEVNGQVRGLQKNFIEVLGIKQLAISTIEADDIIGLLSKGFEERSTIKEILIYSGDKDMYQLLTEKTCVIKVNGIKETERITQETIQDKYGIRSEDWCKLRALSGDGSDGMHGISGIGPKKAAMLMAMGVDASKEKYNGLPNPFSDVLRKQWDQIRLEYQLSIIPKSAFDIKVPDKVQGELHKAIGEVLKDPCRMKTGAGKIGQFKENLLKYELMSLYPRRREYWEIP